MLQTVFLLSKRNFFMTHILFSFEVFAYGFECKRTTERKMLGITLKINTRLMNECIRQRTQVYDVSR